MSRTLLALLVVLCLSPVVDAAAKEAEEPPIWVVSSTKIPPDRVEAFMAASDRYVIPIDNELKSRGLLLDRTVLQHYYADEWNVVVISRYRDWNAIDEANDASDGIEEELYSEEERDAFDSETQGCAPDFHRDQIYSEHVPGPADE
jgi:hypothetical protein